MVRMTSRCCHYFLLVTGLAFSSSLVAAAPAPPNSHVVAKKRPWHIIGGGESADRPWQNNNGVDDIASRHDDIIVVVVGRGGDIQQQDGDDEKLKISLSPLAFMSIFGFLGGWSHAVCNRKFDCYASLMTGHLLNMSIFLAEKNWKEALWRMSIICSYAGGAATARSIELKFEEKDTAAAAAAAAVSTNQHFNMIAPIVFALFIIADRLERGKIALLSFGYGLFYPSVSAALGGTITHLMTGHTTNVARLVGGKQMHHKGMKKSTYILCSVISGAVFGTRVMGLLGEDFPYFSVLGVLYFTSLLLMV